MNSLYPWLLLITIHFSWAGHTLWTDEFRFTTREACIARAAVFTQRIVRIKCRDSRTGEEIVLR